VVLLLLLLLLCLIACRQTVHISVIVITYVVSACANAANSTAVTKTRQRAILLEFVLFKLYTKTKHSLVDVLLLYAFAHCIWSDHSSPSNCRDCKITLCA
jgi:hypothetical protein